MLAGEEFTTLAGRDGHQATLACARFKGESGAFIVAGDMSEKLASHRSLSSAVSHVPSVKAIPLRDDLSPLKAHSVRSPAVLNGSRIKMPACWHSFSPAGDWIVWQTP